ncbi:hypothetical protein [Emticicia oligotrophica]|uniref:hypothetical protein n=1 Tax=Emticicia oligotrophica TaxID=312279 RepID=UPI00273B8E56|nr:hypothetical protein [Emticicia oligotrophica]
MKKLQITQMEGLQGGWDWGRAAAGCGGAVSAANWSGATAYASLAGGPVGGGAVALGSCIVGGILGGISK